MDEEVVRPELQTVKARGQDVARAAEQQVNALLDAGMTPTAILFDPDCYGPDFLEEWATLAEITAETAFPLWTETIAGTLDLVRVRGLGTLAWVVPEQALLHGAEVFRQLSAARRAGVLEARRLIEARQRAVRER